MNDLQYALKLVVAFITVDPTLIFLVLNNILYQLGEFGCVYKGIWMHTAEDTEKLSDEVAVKTIKSMDTCIMYIHDHKKKVYTIITTICWYRLINHT